MEYYQLCPKQQIPMKFYSRFIDFHSRNCIWKCRQKIGGQFVSASMCFNHRLYAEWHIVESCDNIIHILSVMVEWECPLLVYTLAADRCGCKLKFLIFTLTSRIDIFGISFEISLRRMPQILIYIQSILVEIMPWCLIASSHYLIQWWPSSMSPYGVNGSQWDKKYERSFT